MVEWKAKSADPNLSTRVHLADDEIGIALAEEILLVELLGLELNIGHLLAAGKLLASHKDLPAIKTRAIL